MHAHTQLEEDKLKDKEAMAWFLAQPGIVTALANGIGGMDRLQRVAHLTSPLAKTTANPQLEAMTAFDQGL
jgi:hypothetical protein